MRLWNNLRDWLGLGIGYEFSAGDEAFETGELVNDPFGDFWTADEPVQNYWGSDSESFGSDWGADDGSLLGW